MKDHSAFLHYVRNYITESPEAAAWINDHVAAGIEASRREALERAADMEVALTVALAKKWKNGDAVILQKLRRWKDKSSINWESTIEKIEGSGKPVNQKERA